MFNQMKRPALIAAPKAFIDTVGILIDKRPPNQFFLDIRPYCFSCVPSKSKDLQLENKLCIHRPRPEAFAALVDLACSRDLKINELHVALDLSVESIQASETLVEWLGSRMVKRRPGRHRFRTFFQTVYSGERTWGINQIAMYPTDQSKVYGEAAAHIEWRTKGTQPVRRLGIHRPSDLGKLNMAVFWKDRLILEEAQPEKLGEELRVKGIVGSNGWTDRRLGWTYIRDYLYQDGSDVPALAMAMRAMCRKWRRINRKKVLQPIDPTPFLPRPNDSAQSIISLAKK